MAEQDNGPWTKFTPASNGGASGGASSGPWERYAAPPATATVTPKPQSSLIRRTLGDTAVDVGRGIIGVGEAAVGLANIPTFGYAGKGLEAIGYDPGRTKEMIGSLHSPERQAARAKVDQAEGFVGTAKAMLQNPSTIAGVVAESAPSILGGGAVARGLTAIPKLSRLGATARGAIGEGAVGAGAAAEGIRQQTEDGTLSGRQVVAALGTGATTAGFAGAGGVLARRLGIGDVDTALAGRVPGMADEGMRPGLVRRTAQGAVTEGALEEMPQSMSEQAWQNFALDRPLGEGVGESAAEGLLAGAAMGGTFSAVSGSNSRPLAQPVAADKPSGEALDEAIRQQFAAQHRTDGTTRINSRVLGRAWGVPAKQVQAAARRVARDFDPAAVSDMTPEERAAVVASDAPAQQGNLTDTLRQQQEGQLLADIEAAETPEDRAAAEAALAQFQQQVAAFDRGATDGNDLDASPAPVAPAGDGVAAGGEALPGSSAQLDGDGNGDAGGSMADVPADLAGAGATGDAQPALTAAPLALPPPGPVTVDAQGNATTAAQADASAREREALGLTPDVLRAQELRNARQAVTYPDAAPGSLADAANAVPTLLDGSPVPDPAGGPLSRAVNEGVASGAVPTVQQAPMAEPMPEPVAEQPGPSADTGLMPGVRMEPLGEKGLLVHGDVAAIRERLAEAGFRKKGRNQNGVLRFDAKGRDELEVALAQDAVPQPRRQWKEMTGPDGRPVLDSQGRPRKEPVLDYSTDTLVHWLAANGGVNYEQVRAQGGADPALMRDNSVQRPFGVIGIPALRRNGGMSLDEVRERMQQSGWLPADDPNSPATVSDNDALDLIMDAINGREVYHPYEGAEARLMREAAERDAQPSHFGDALLDETTDENAIAAWEDDFAPFAETLGREPVEDDIGPAYTVAELMKMALDLGADPFDVHQPSNRPQHQHARVLWDIIKELRDGTDLGRVSETGGRSDTPASGGGAAFVPSPATRPGEAGSDAEPSGRGANDGGGSGGNSSVGDFQLAGQNAQPEQVAQPASQSGLFAPPTRGEMMDAEIARRDAERNGQAGMGRTDMMAGDGELFAGPRPEQADIEQQSAPNLSEADAQVNESAGTLPSPGDVHQNAPESNTPDPVQADIGDAPRQQLGRGEGQRDPGTLYGQHIVTDADGVRYMVLHARHHSVTAVPLVEGQRPEVSRSGPDVVRFNLNPNDTLEAGERAGPLFDTGKVYDLNALQEKDAPQAPAVETRSEDFVQAPGGGIDFGEVTGAKGNELLWDGSEPPSTATGTQAQFAAAPVSQPVVGDPNALSQKQLGDDPTTPPPALDDFGEKLEGARKHLPPSLAEELGDEQIASQPLSKIWPANAHESIEDDTAAALAFAARGAIPAKPRRADRLRAWVQKVKAAREIVRDPELARELAERGEQLARGSRELSALLSRARLLSQLSRDTWGRVESVGEYPDAYRHEKGKQVASPFSSVSIDGKRHTFDVGRIGPDEVQKVKELLGTEAPKKGGLTRSDFEIRGPRSGGSAFINRKGDPELRPLKTFTGEDAVKLAREFLSANVAELEAEWEAVKKRDNVAKADTRRDQNRERVGENRRDGKDVTEQMFTDAFGFRGVQFGNWVKQGKGAKDRQGLLNEAYDALLDLADILGIPSRAISLNGTMGLSLGARGSGRAAAHFERDNLVINLTKTKGAGSLAHEWFHSLDNYFSRLRGSTAASPREGDYITYKPEPAYVQRNGRGVGMSAAQLRDFLKRTKQWDEGKSLDENAAAAAGGGYQRDPNHQAGVRPQVERAFAELVEALNASPMAARSRKLDKTLDGYWHRIIERGARSFENYVISKMAQRGWTNDFLANVRSWGEWAELGKNKERYPYLFPEEEAPVVAAFDNLFATIETRTDPETGNVGLFSRPDDAISSGPRFLTQAADVQAAVRQVLDGWQGDKPVVRVVQTVAEARARGAALPANAPADFEGWWDGGSTVYIVAENNRDVARALQVLSHEAIGHYGIERILGEKEWKRLIADVQRLRGLKQANVSPKVWAALQSAERRYGRLSQNPESNEVFAKEFLAIMAEQGVRTGLTSRVMAAIRRWLAKLGIPMNLTKGFRESELLTALHRGRELVTQPSSQSTRTARAGDPARAMAFARPTDSEVRALVAQYVGTQGAPTEAQIAEAVRQYRETERTYGGRKAWESARDAGRTKLNYGQWVQVRTPNFKRWFGDWEGDAASASKVTDPDTGEPMVVYHGSSEPRTVFEPAWKVLERETTKAEREGSGDIARLYRAAKAEPELHFFAEEEGTADSYGDTVTEAFLNVRNPAQGADNIDAVDSMLENDNDGAGPFDDTTSSGRFGGLAWVVRASAQIKSATGNVGTFDPASADIRFSRQAAAPKMPSGVGVLSSEQLDVLRQLGLLSQDEEADLSGQQQVRNNEGPRDARGFRLTTARDEDAFLSAFPEAARYGGSATASGAVPKLLERVRQLSERAVDDLGGKAEIERTLPRHPVGPFSGIETRARIKNAGTPQESLVVQVYGKEQIAAGLDEEPALTWTVNTRTGELDVNGPHPERATFREFEKRGWAVHARGQAGEFAVGWTSLTSPDGSATLPLVQLMPMLADVHARYRALRKEDRVGLHWARITGATGGPAGRETAVFFSRPDATTQTPPSGGVSASVGQRLTGAVRKTLDVVDKKTGRGAVKRPDWVSQSVAGKFDTFSGKKPTKQWFDELRDRAGEKLTQRIFDQFRSMRNYSAEGFMQAHLSRATDGTLESVFNYGIPVLKDGAYYIDEKNGGLKGLLTGLGSVEEMQRFFMWIAGNRSERLAAEGRENLFTPEDIKEMKAYSDGKLPDGRSRKSVYDQTLRQFNRFQRAILDIAERAGEIDPESRALWQSDFYLPYYRVAEETGQPFSPGNAGLVRQNVVKRLKGGTEKLGDPLENVLSNWSAMLSASMRNMAANKSLAEAARVGAAERVPSGTKGATWTMVDGKQQHWLVHDPLLLESLEAMNFQGYNNPVMKWAGKFKRALSVGVTVNPSYRIRNLTRDIVSALATADTGDVDAKNPLRSLASLGTSLARGWGLTTRDSDTNIQLMAGGGAVRFGLSNDGDQAANSKRLIAMGINENQILNTPEKVKNAIRRWWDAYQETGDRAETISRAVIYDRAIAAGKSHLEASFEARDLMNFTSMGSSAAVRALAQVLPFFNARLQGLDKLGRAAKNDPRRFWAVAGHVAMLSALLYAIQGDDEEYQALPDYVRDTYWPVNLGGTWVYIPKPFELGSLGTVVERGFELMMAGDDYQAKDFRDSMVSILTNTLAMNPVPQIVKPAGEAWFNYDMFRNAPIDSMAQERLLPQDRYTARTSGAAVLAGRAAGVSPQKIEHMVKGYLGWIGIQALNVGDWLARDFAGMPSNPNRDLTSVNNWLVVGDFVKEAGSTPSKYLERFYESQKALDQIYATATQARRAGDTERALELLNDPALRTRPAFKAADRRITRINQSIRRVTADRSLSATEKNRRLENLRKQREEVARRVDRLARAAG